MQVALGLRIVLGALLLAGCGDPPPAGLASVQPSKPPGWSVRLAPLGDFPAGRLIELTGFYADRYGLSTGVYSPSPIDSAFDPSRRQLIGERLIDGLQKAYPAANEPSVVVIGVTDQDLYLSTFPEWAWAFGIRQFGHLAVISTNRMQGVGLFSERLEATRLRKMVTKYIGLLYFNLKESDNPESAVYGPIQSVADLDRMGEEF